jgi:hypothetical protein
MKRQTRIVVVAVSVAVFACVWLAHAARAAGGPSGRQADPPIGLHPTNPHYFLFRGKPTVLIGSTEHYGAVLNLDFDHVPYLQELKAHRLNVTRAFSGAYCEQPGAFNITKNTLAPAANRFICPWARSDQPGYPNGGNKFDLTRWEPAYFERLRSFVAEAGKRGVVVEYVLFCPFYDESMWALSPMNAKNNVNGIGNLKRDEVYTLKDEMLQAAQEAMVRKAVAELRGFDNVYFEICNEPYFGGVTIPWQRRIADVIVEAERDLPAKHLIAQNIANATRGDVAGGKMPVKIDDPYPPVSVFNFHYAYPPEAVTLNYALGKALGDDETGFRGRDDVHYRTEAWDFLIAGGAVYDNLDYSFTVEHEDGSFHPLPEKQPGGGGRNLRHQLSALMDFMNSLKFVEMKPATAVVRGGVPAGASARCLAEAGEAYAVYVHGGPGQAGQGITLALELPAGPYRVEWVNPRTGNVDRAEDLNHAANGEVRLASPPYTEDVALKIVRRVVP